MVDDGLIQAIEGPIYGVNTLAQALIDGLNSALQTPNGIVNALLKAR